MRVGNSGNHSIESPSTKQGGHAGAAQDIKESKDVRDAKESRRGSAADVDKSSARGGTSAEISARAKEFGRAKAVASDTPDVRDDRIEALKRKISEGSYKVDADAIADRMVDEHLKMSGS